MLDASKSVIVLTRFLSEGRSRNAQSRILGKLSQQEFKVLRVEFDIGVKAANHIVVQIPYPAVADIEGMYLAREVAFPALRRPYQLDPFVLSGMPFHDFIGAIN
jgi:hypothetical protein